MKLKRLEIHNYKSLRDVFLEPAPISVFVGPNAAGKSNFADALDFLGEVYRWDLEGAVKKKGGFENICFRQARPSEWIRFRVVLEIEAKFRQRQGRSIRVPLTGLTFDHSFRLKPVSGSSFSVSSESLSIFSLDGFSGEPLFRLSRHGDRINVEVEEHGRKDIEIEFESNVLEKIVGASVRPEALAFDALQELFSWIKPFSRGMAALRVFQLSPHRCREAGVPTPNADLDRFGGNLPAVIDYLKGNEPKRFEELLNAVRWIMPTLESIEIDFTHGKRLGLLLKEAGVKQPWPAEDISDGTIQAIALLAATFDPRIPLLVIEEPENSVHPWAIRSFIQAFREASETKQIFLTTHSPIVIDQIRPEELWVVQRPKLETEITPVLELDPSLKDAWEKAKFTLFEYLDSGALPEAVPVAGV